VNMKRFIFLFALATCLVLLASPLPAHHSTAEYEMTALSNIKGTVTKFEWSNPHAYIYIQAKDEKGAVVEWTANWPAWGCFPGSTGKETQSSPATKSPCTEIAPRTAGP
jgi:hypothetical protein